ncbi:DUF4397 domain-containing protein [Pedobacter caeni]|nr:DUF4397 domain-containing protein [Pedobacter caeni]
MKKIFFIGLSLIVVLSSCLKTPKPAPVGEAKLRYVHAASGVASQNFFVDGQKLGMTSIVYGQTSASSTVQSGGRNFVFADEATNAVTGGTSGSLEIGGNYTIFLIKDLEQKPAAYGIGENLTAPETGKAKVRFMHFNSFLNNSVSIGISGGTTPLEPALGFGKITNYFQVPPGTKFTVTATGVTNSPEIDFGIVADKIYTIWLGGNASTDLRAFYYTSN